MRKIILPSIVAAGTVLLSTLSLVNSCGMLVHMDVTERALNSFISADESYPYEKILH
jgi:hypothetical protein